ncbi:phage major capsid protein [Clostridium botulinum]|uniref:phage major capsid protein n=1 Tax=Clostridium botulinum TaxID=1491 RepID=UPI000774C6C1|nr:phage major capsid protein [Clostridium botulinum]NFH80831.1 phage major capsid protein [Clostridium botulinum]NFH83208.1 phage major capsid protein [Clostridium botulinum]NFI12073.1 phage major capsid protein [Clostridium botulinum]NFI15778.1 phage major capsid protein [Clostridium botulinum]NFO83902.1 phage major capsid protein [Clostridium botulinum]
MKSKDIIKQELTQKLSAAMQSENQEDMINAFVEFATGVQQEVLEDFKAYQETQDKEILQKRGIHQLTQKETKFYQSWIDAAKAPNPRQAITNLDIALPETVIDNVMVDMRVSHPLLEMIDFQNMTALTKMLMNKKGIQLAKWGAINSVITTELEGAIGKLDLSLNKLTAFMPVAKDMLLVGPQWIDAYVRAVLSEAVAYGLEEGIINGTGKDMPIGMNRDIHEGVSVSSSTGYPKKTVVSISDLSPATFGKLLATLAKDPVDEKKARTISDLVLIVNPFDYYKKVMPATTIQLQDGTYKNNVLPYPTTIVQSTQVAEGEAILGLAKKYAMGIGTGNKEGKIEYSDEYKFLEDERYYIIKLIGNGQALDDNAFMLLDISGLEDLTYNVKVKGTVKTKEQA